LGFSERLREHGLPPPEIVSGDFRYESGIAAGRTLLGKSSRPDAIFCANDLMAMGLMDIARQQFGLGIPDDLMVAGFDDIAPASWSSYDLTTVVQDADLMTQAALSILTRALCDPDHRSERILLEGQLIERRSTTRNRQQPGVSLPGQRRRRP
jgi:DNA-binding LacI/PurR family transcriptional regulator